MPADPCRRLRQGSDGGFRRRCRLGLQPSACATELRSDRPYRQARVALGRWALNGAAAIALAYILTPLIFVTWLAFFRQEIPSFPPEGYSLRWFAAILDQTKFVDGFSLSFQVGVIATLIGLALGVPAALCLSRASLHGREAAGQPAADAADRARRRAGHGACTSSMSRSRTASTVDVLGTFYAPGRRPCRDRHSRGSCGW